MDNNQKTLPPIIRQSSRESHNKLAKRLYKNNSMKKLNNTAQFSYLRNINPDSSILGSTMTKNSSSKNLLIPSVSLKRHKQHDTSQRSMQITQGKILLGKSQDMTFLHYKGDLKHQLQKSSSNPKTLFKKIPRFDSINQGKIVPDQLLGCSSDQQASVNESKIMQRFDPSPKSKQKRLLKGFKSKQKKFTQDLQTLTPNDFIQLLQQDGTITNEFCYLKKVSHPYDLKIVEFQSSNNRDLPHMSGGIKPSILSAQEEYITISSRGVSYFSEENSRFVPLQRWKKQAYYFTKLMKLQFFSNYRTLKSFAKWKKHIRKTAMKSTTDKLRNELMIGDKYLRKAMLGVKNSCFIMQNDINYCKFDDCQNVMQFQTFKTCQQQFIQNQFQKRIIEVQQDIKNNLIDKMSESMRQFKQQNKISTSNEGKGIPLLIGDEKNLDMPYTKEATLRIQQQKFKKFLKLVEFMIVDSKIKMMNESTQKTVKKMQEENQTYERQVLDTNYKYLFKGKQYIKCNVKINIDNQSIVLKPSRDQLNYMFEEIVNRAIVKLCRNHKRIINDDEILQIIYDSNQKIVKQPDTNILKVIIMADDRQQKIVNLLNSTVNATYSYVERFSNKFTNLVQMYFQNMAKLDTIQMYQAKDHQIIMQSLQRWKTQLTEISSLSQEHESAIFLLDFQEFKSNAIKCVSECLQKMKRILPEIFTLTTENLLAELQNSQQKMRIKPVEIQDFIEFQKNKIQITCKMQQFADRLAQINCIWIIMKTSSSGSQMSTISRQQRQINRLQTKLNSLRTRLQQAQMNTKAYQTNAQQLLKSRVPIIKEDIYKLYAKIKASKYDVTSSIYEVSKSIQEYQSTHARIEQSIAQLKQFQQQLSMEEYNQETINKFTLYFTNYQNIWHLHESMFCYKEQIMKQPWTVINIQEAKKQVETYFNQAMKMKKLVTSLSVQDEEFKVQLSDIDVLSYVFLQAKNMKPLMQTVQCLRDKSLGQKQWREIKSYFQKINKQEVCQVIDIDNKQATLSSILQHKVSEQLDFIESIVFRSKKQQQIHNKMTMVNKFWIQSSANNAGKNLTDNFEKYYWDIITEIDQKITVINGISEDTTQVQAQQLRQNIIVNKQMFDSLRVLLVDWEVHQRYLHYFEPIFVNSYWKANTRELKLYNQAEINWKKLLKQCKDYSLKRWASNQKAIATLRQNIILFQQLKTAVQEFLTVKRDIFPKFYFLSNQELLHVLLAEKEVRSIEEHINKVFTCVKSLDVKQAGHVIVGTECESIQVKFSKAFNTIEVEEIFKLLQEGIKTTVKSNLRSCLSHFQKEDFNKKKWIKEHLLQSLLFIQKSQYTKIVEYDYMGHEGQDISQYLIYQNNQIKQLQTFLKDYSDEPGMGIGKIQTLILQEIMHRDTSELLLLNRTTDEESYEWQRQIRCYYTVDTAVTKFLVNEIDYGYEFVNMIDVYPYVLMSEKETIDLTMALKLRHLPVVKGRQTLIQNFSKFNAKYYHNVLCSKQLSHKYLTNVCYGTYLEGSYVQMENAQNLQFDQLSIVANFLKQIHSAIMRKDKSFNFGWKKNSLNFNAGIILNLQDTSDIKEFPSKISVPTRGFEFNPLPYSTYVNLMMETRKKPYGNIGEKLNKIIELINQLQGYQVFHFIDIKKLLSFHRIKSIQNYQSYFVKEINELISEKLVSTKKIIFYRKIVNEIFYQNKTGSEILNESMLSNNVKLPKDKSDFKFVVNHLVEITDKKTLCIIAGPTQAGKTSVISEAYKQRICRGFEIDILNVDTLDEKSLFGCYINDLWQQGILIKKIKLLPASKDEWIIFQGSHSTRINSIINRLNHPYLQLSNGEVVFLSKQCKYIFSIYNFEQCPKQVLKNIQIISSTKFITVEQSMYLMMQKRIKPHFQCVQNYSQLSNMCINRIEKVLELIKTVGYKDDYLKPENVIRYVVNILDAILTSVSSDIKISKQFSKGIEKIFVWTIYWCVGSGLPEGSASKYQKCIFETIKTDIERSQNISLLKLQFQTPLGSFKKIKNSQTKIVNNEFYLETLDLKSKANFAQLMIKGNFPIILTGKTGSGKSKFMQYLQSYLNPDEYAYLPINLRKQMTYQQFKDILFKKTRNSMKNTKRKCFCSSTNKRLVIFIDDFNLLQLDSQIGQFLNSCVKNGFYYDMMTHEKIFIYNISFVVAENDTYESRIDNRLLKYFKPIYLNQIELKDISEMYKQQYPGMQHSREIFDSSVSLHNFVINLQSNGQINRKFPLSHKSALNIMKCVTEFHAEKQVKQGNDHKQPKQTKEDMAKIWAYISTQQYRGYGIGCQTLQKIQKQILNLLNLIIQNSNQKSRPVTYLPQLLDELTRINPLINSDSQLQEYYEYLSFLVSLSEPHNLLCIGEPLPQFIKSQILQHVADVHSLKYIYATNVERLKNSDFKNSLVHLSAQSFGQLIKMIGYISNYLECKHGRFVLDCQNFNDFLQLIKNVPYVYEMFHIFNKNPQQSTIIVSPQYKQLLNELQVFMQTTLTQRQSLAIVSNLLQQQKYIRSELSRKKKLSQTFIQRYLKLQQEISINTKTIQQLNITIKELHSQEQLMFTKKKQLNQALINLRNVKIEDESEGQKAQKIKKCQDQLYQAQNQLKNMKKKKKQTSETVSNLQSINNLSRDVEKKLLGLYEQFLETKGQIQKIEQTESSVIFCLSLYYYGIRQNNLKYQQFVQKKIQKKQFDINNSLKVIFQINPTSITKQILIWSLQSKKLVVKDKNNRFLRQVKRAVPKLRVFDEIHSLQNQYRHINEPIVYTGKYDSILVKIPQLTYIVKQLSPQIISDFKSIITIEDTLQNQSQDMKQTLYKHKEREIIGQIHNFEEEIYRVQIQSWEDTQRIISEFTNPKMQDLKHLKSILYFQNDRVNQLHMSLSKAQGQLENKYGSIVQICVLFKSYLSIIQKQFNYFFHSEQKFRQLFLRCISIRSSGEKTHKQLLQASCISKKSFSNLKSKRQIQVEKMTSKRNLLQPQINLQSAQLKTERMGTVNQIELELQNVNQDNSIDTFRTLMIDQILKEVILALKSSDSLYAYALLACSLIQSQFGFSNVLRQCVSHAMKKEKVPVEKLQHFSNQIQIKLSQNQSQNQGQTDIIQLSKILQSFHQSLKEESNSLIQKLIKFSDIQLNKSFEELLSQKYEINTSFFKQSIVVISNLRENPFDVVQKHIFSRIQDCNWCYLSPHNTSSEKILQISDKCSVNWFVIVNNVDPLIFEQLKKAKIERNFNFALIYTDQASFLKLKENASSTAKSHYLQELALIYAQDTHFIYKNISDIYLNYFSKIAEQRPEIQHLARIVYYEQATQLLKDIYSHQNQNNQFYLTKAINEVISNLKNIDVNHFISIMNNLCYNNQRDKQNIVLKQAKKLITKNEDLLNSFLAFFVNQNICEDITFDGSLFVSENGKILAQTFSLASPQQIVNLFVPSQFKKKYSVDNLYFQIQDQETKSKKLEKNNINTFNQSQVLMNIEKILNDMPCIGSLQSQGGKNAKHYYKQILKDQIRIKLNGIRKIQQNLKKYKRVIETPKVLSDSTQKEFKNLLQYLIPKEYLDLSSKQDTFIETLTSYLLREDRSIQFLQKIYHSKQSNKVFQPIHFNDPSRFIKYYLYEMNFHINFTKGQIQARYLTDKDKQTHYDDKNNQCKSLTLSQISVKNAKFDQNKNVIELNEKNQQSKITNVHVCFNDKEISHINSALPIYFQDKQLLTFFVINKVKDESVWREKLYLQIEK